MSKKRILVVEDDPDGQEMITTMLQHLQYEVDTADDAEVASHNLFGANNTYNAVIIDLALPGKDGWELLSDILDNPTTSNIPCVAVTAHHTSKLREETIRAGFVAYFPKPIDATSLGRELDQLI